jgi:phospholipid/cholesterol/gamma-HCH transport system substrate-binding protein
VISFLVLVALVGGGFAAYELTKSEVSTYTITADVEQAPNLFEGGRVMVRGVEVGSISAVVPRPEGVRLTLEINDDIKVPADARLSVVPITVIADRYVQLYPPYSSGPVIKPGTNLSLDRTTIPAELDDVLKQLRGLLAALQPEEGEERGPLARLIVRLDSVFKGRTQALSGGLDKSASVLENLANSGTDITGLIRNLDSVFITLANRASELGLVNERFALVAEALEADQRDLEGTIENIGLLSEEAAGIVTESGENLGRSFRRLSIVLEDVLDHQDQLTLGIKWMNVITEAAGAVDASGRGLNAYTGVQAPPGTARASYNYRLEQRDTIGCQRIDAVAQTVLVVTPEANVEDLVFTVLDTIPDPYDDDIEFLAEILVKACVNFPSARAAAADIDPETRAVIDQLVHKVGEKRLKEMLSEWFLAGLKEGVATEAAGDGGSALGGAESNR